MSIKDEVKELLKTGWWSNFAIDVEVKSAQGQRRLRDLRKEGLPIIERNRIEKVDGRVVRYKEFTLMGQMKLI